MMTITKYSKTYDRIYNIADHLWKLHDPCKIKNGKCKYNKSVNPWRYETTCCGNDCKYLSKKGCTVKSLGCKLFYCSDIKKNHPEFVKIIDLLTGLINYDSIYNLRFFASCYMSKRMFIEKIKADLKYYKDD